MKLFLNSGRLAIWRVATLRLTFIKRHSPDQTIERESKQRFDKLSELGNNKNMQNVFEPIKQSLKIAA